MLRRSSDHTGLPPAAPVDDARRDRRRALLEALAVGLAVAVAVGAAVAGLWHSSTTTVREHYRNHLVQLATVAAVQVDPVAHAAIRRPEQDNSPEYRAAVEPLRRLRTAIPEIRYLYTLVRDGASARFVLDSADPGDHDGDGVEDHSTVGELSLSPQTAKLEALGWNGQPGRPTATQLPYTDAWGTFMSGYAPILDAQGRQEGVVGVDLDASGYVAHLEVARRNLLVGLLPAALLIVLLTLTVYRLRYRGFADAREIASGALHAQLAARKDRLTGLANRTLFMEQLNAAIARTRTGTQQRFGVLFLDFDHFKLINDTLGHDAGDELLQQIAVRLRGALRVTDAFGEDASGNVVARFGGDEFAVLINDLRTDTDSERVAARLLQTLEPVYALNAGDVHSSASIGIVVGHDEQANAEAVIRNADIAMYEAKRSGRACHVVFDDAMHKRLTRRVGIERGLRKAIGNGEITLAYQPIVAVETGRMVSAEVLLRWAHPEFGDIPPAEFIPIAEDSGLIVQIGEWALLEACTQLAAWRREWPEEAPATISINVSRAELALGGRLLSRINTVLKRTGLPGRCLQLEVTEREVMRDPSACNALMKQLRAMGVRLTMDDFGTGTSSLACLREYPFDAVKIDRSIVKGLTHDADVMALIHATLTLVENLGMASAAEGVEDAAQLAVLQSLGCSYAQGYYFSRPVPADQLIRASRPLRAVDSDDGDDGAIISAA
jgi:diguanylate cyclase (GGDEF)-like protein